MKTAGTISFFKQTVFKAVGTSVHRGLLLRRMDGSRHDDAQLLPGFADGQKKILCATLTELPSDGVGHLLPARAAGRRTTPKPNAKAMKLAVDMDSQRAPQAWRAGNAVRAKLSDPLCLESKSGSK